MITYPSPLGASIATKGVKSTPSCAASDPYWPGSQLLASLRPARVAYVVAKELDRRVSGPEPVYRVADAPVRLEPLRVAERVLGLLVKLDRHEGPPLVGLREVRRNRLVGVERERRVAQGLGLADAHGLRRLFRGGRRGGRWRRNGGFVVPTPAPHQEQDYGHD